jgi:hypothetical protein
MKLAIAAVAAACLTACASPAVYQDPKTGQVAQCNASTPGVFPIIAQSEINSCSQAYERMGWQKR